VPLLLCCHNSDEDESILAKAIEYMIVDALLAAEPHFHFSDQVFQPEKFVYLTDDIMPRIESSTEIVSNTFSRVFCRTLIYICPNNRSWRILVQYLIVFVQGTFINSSTTKCSVGRTVNAARSS
jgi:hypothetical protein